MYFQETTLKAGGIMGTGKPIECCGYLIGSFLSTKERAPRKSPTIVAVAANAVECSVATQLQARTSPCVTGDLYGCPVRATPTGLHTHPSIQSYQCVVVG